MQTKGTAVRVLPLFIKEYFPEKYDLWLDNLPQGCKEIFTQPIFPTAWYPLYEGMVLPTKILGDLFYDSVEDAALEVGRYSARVSLKGVYKVFIKITSLKFLFSQATNIVKTYYHPVDVGIEQLANKQFILRFGKNEEHEKLVYYRVLGWIEELAQLTQGYVPNIEMNVNQDSSGLFNVWYKITF